MLTGAQLAEHEGSRIADEMLNAVLNSSNQAEACRSIMAGLNSAFNPDEDPVINAVAGGFSVRIVNVLERGFAAIRADVEGEQ